MTLQQKLHDLYLVDQQLRGLQSRLDAATSRLTKQQSKLEQLQRQRAELAEQAKQAQVKASTLEKQAKEADDRISHLRESMLNVKNNKEYQALAVEVGTIKVDKGKVEDQALEAMTRVEALKAEMGGLDAKIAEQAKLMTVADTEVKTCRGQVGQQLDELTVKRAAAASEVPEDAKTTFNRMCEIHEGEAMASIVEESRRHMEYSCGGCYIGLPAERVNALMRRPDDLVTCPSCGRILWVEHELRQSLTQVSSK